MQIVYLDARSALIKGPWGASYMICDAKYAGPPDVVEFTGDIPGNSLVGNITELRLLKDIAIGIGLDPNEKGPPQQMLHFILDLRTGRVSLFKSEDLYRLALTKQLGLKEYPALQPVERAMKSLAIEFDSKHK